MKLQEFIGEFVIYGGRLKSPKKTENGFTQEFDFSSLPNDKREYFENKFKKLKLK
jgi:hypothetical protein